MSYVYNIDGHVVIFANEENYLQARLAFLNASYDGVIFIDFLQSSHAAGNFSIESLVHEQSSFLSFANSINSIYTEGENTDSLGNALYSNLNTWGSWTIPPYPYLSDNTFVNNYLSGEAAEVGPDNSCGEKEKKEIKEEPPDDPIDNRFDILDL